MVNVVNLHQRERRAKCRSLGICIHCCCRPVTLGFSSCELCRNAIKLRMSITRYKDRPDKPDECPLCGDTSGRFYWHHWDDGHPKVGMWICPHCNLMVELEDRGLVEKYRDLRSKYLL